MVVRPQPPDFRRGAAHRERYRALARATDAATWFLFARWRSRSMEAKAAPTTLPYSYIRTHWEEINALCKLNSIPFNATGEKIRDDGLWCVYEFTWQMDAILFWDRFQGRWLRGSEFHYPERPKDLPKMKPLKNWPRFDPRKARGSIGVQPL